MNDLSPEEKKSYAYFCLIEENQENDFLGMIAYALYKRNKIEFIKNYKIKNNGIMPDAKEMKKFQEHQCLPNNVKSLKNEAASIANTFINLCRRDRDKQFTDEIAQKDHIIKSMESLCPKKGGLFGSFLGWCSGVAQSIVGAFCFMVIAIFFVIWTKWPVDLFSEIRQKLSQDTVQSDSGKPRDKTKESANDSR